MTRPTIARTLASMLLAGSVLASPAAAQDAPAAGAAEDWDLGRDPARRLVIAAVTFDNFGLAVRCLDDRLSLVLSGLPAGSGERAFGLALDGEAEQSTRWVSARNGTSAFALWPRYAAGRLAEGGRLAVSVPDGDRVRRYQVDIPRSETAVAQVFEACGHTLRAQDGDPPPSSESFDGLRWDRRPSINFPDRSSVEAGLAAIQCRVRAGGGLRDCRVESEFPEGSGFGRAATLGAHQTARLAPITPGDDIEDRTITFVTRYNLAPYDLTPPTRIPRP